MGPWFRGVFNVLIGTLALASAGHAIAASAVNAKILDVDLAPKIAAAATHRERFAVDVPHAASTADAGSWETIGNTSTWRYAVRIPTAVSLSFHASKFDLPAGATLTVTANDGTRAIYTQTSVRGELWSRFCPAATPPAPNGETAVALYNSLAAVWESNADATSFTNPVTLKSLLDPDNTGARISDGLEMLTGVNFYASSNYALTGQGVTLNWSSGNGISCTASGGVVGDGWSRLRILRRRVAEAGVTQAA